MRRYPLRVPAGLVPQPSSPVPRSAGWHPLLVAAYPVLFLWSQNVGVVGPADVAVPLVFVVAVAGLALVVISRVLGDRRRAALILSPAILGCLLYGHVADLLKPIGVPVRLQQVGWLALLLLAVVGAVRLGAPRLRRIDLGLVRMAGLLVAITAVTIAPSVIGDVATSGARLRPPDGADPPATTTRADRRDVYWLVFDRYGSDRSLEAMYGIRNDLSGWLTERGFTVLADSHANYVRTALSMATTLEMTPLTDLAAQMGRDNGDLGPPYASLQDSRTVRQFHALGYRYHHIGSWWGPTRGSRSADVNHSLDGDPDFSSGLIDASVVPAIQRILGQRRDPIETRAYENGIHGLDELASLRDVPGPKFVLAHILLPHPPLVFDADGRFIPQDEARTLTQPERFERQLTYTNERIKAIVDGLLTLPDARRPIIILQADEGPWTRGYAGGIRAYDWSTATPEELEIKFGIMNAWYVPGDAPLDLDRAMTAINTFSTLFREFFGLDYAPSPDRVYTSRDWNHPYDLTDVTDRLPGPSPTEAQ